MKHGCGSHNWSRKFTIIHKKIRLYQCVSFSGNIIHIPTCMHTYAYDDAKMAIFGRPAVRVSHSLAVKNSRGMNLNVKLHARCTCTSTRNFFFFRFLLLVFLNYFVFLYTKQIMVQFYIPFLHPFVDCLVKAANECVLCKWERDRVTYVIYYLRTYIYTNSMSSTSSRMVYNH